jgi:hypothetical protein
MTWCYRALNADRIRQTDDRADYRAIALPDGIGPNFIILFEFSNSNMEPTELSFMVAGVSEFLEAKTAFQDQGMKLIDVYFLGTHTGYDLVLDKPDEIRLLMPPGSNDVFHKGSVGLVTAIQREIQTFQVWFASGDNKVFGPGGSQEKYVSIWKRTEEHFQRPSRA